MIALLVAAAILFVYMAIVAFFALRMLEARDF
jgi:hypothetical protein